MSWTERPSAYVRGRHIITIMLTLTTIFPRVMNSDLCIAQLPVKKKVDNAFLGMISSWTISALSLELVKQSQLRSVLFGSSSATFPLLALLKCALLGYAEQILVLCALPQPISEDISKHSLIVHIGSELIVQELTLEDSLSA
ncbi:hypothetical protein E1B28_005460 [Marasmius oreades]|uniref:Uncharacterized protein n=1 Tax=Marasmius oreades TaxID=181124 RepID=A0A9P7UVP9_9AGAR|nr:uncharacterized protein E1B28_005460 [Marasmius oreades]KAG7094636.1 hypothetical protein E1B28_005460 [Marasmius oreades]